MDVKHLAKIPAWEWPSDAGSVLLAVLRDSRAPASDRSLAGRLAGDLVVMNDEMARVLLSIIENAGETEDVRGAAAIALGPVLEEGDAEGFDEAETVPISEATYRRIRMMLHAVFADPRAPVEVRRRVLEASVRAPAPWHADAVRTAWAENDDAWKITAMFGMGFVPGFDREILEGLKSPNGDLRYEAIVAAGRAEVDGAWPYIEKIVQSEHADKDLLLAAIDAAPGVRPDETFDLLDPLTDSRDEEVAEAAKEAISMARGLSGEGSEDADDEEEYDEEENGEEGYDEDDDGDERDDEDEEDEEDEEDDEEEDQ